MAESVELGTVRAGQTANGRIFIRGKTPFEIRDIVCEDPRFSFDQPQGKKVAHIIPLHFSAGETIGAFKERVIIETSLSSDGQASTVVNGNVSD